ncbi:MAG TPA: extracellular solute-binding protein [Chloroflexota bacterium]|jgi:ABC-type glycerol-3-phosphate transport system substrate-binding protein|nr:extracellular solute-binding protein [Chloroflexota bacterium]
MMAMRSRRSVLAAVGSGGALAAGLMAAACAPPGRSAESPAGAGETGRAVTLVLLHAWDEARLTLMEQMRDEFQRRQPRITVEFDLTTTASGLASPRVQKLVTAVAAGTPPDVSMIWRGELPALAVQGTLQPLDAPIARDKFDPQIYYEAEWQTSRYDNKAYVLPNVSAGGWYLNYYNRDHLKEVGYGLDQAPLTWGEASAALTKLTKIEGGRITQLGGDAPGGATGFILWLLNNRGKYLSEDGRKVLFDSPETVEALEWWKGFYDPIGGVAAVDTFNSQYQGATAAQAPFTVGAQSMKIQNPSQIFHIKANNPNIDFGVAVPPHGPKEGAGKSYIRGGWGYGMPSGVKHVPESWQLIKWLSATKEAAGWFMQQQLRPSPIKEVNEDSFYVEKLPVAWPQLLKAIARDVAVPITPVDGELDRILSQAMTDIGARQGAVRDLVRQAAADCQREIDTFWSRQGK